MAESKKVIEQPIGGIVMGAGVSRYEWGLAVTFCRQPRFWIFQIQLGPLYAWIEG